MRLHFFGLLAILTFALASCGKERRDEVMNGGMTQAELAARFPADLGPGTVDISKYPENIRRDYKLFLSVCSACHTPARPLNSPVASRADWKRFVHRMHVKMDNRGYILDKADEVKIVEFLAYDSKVRKIDDKENFKRQQDALEIVFQQVLDERSRLIEEQTKRLPVKETPYVGVK